MTNDEARMTKEWRSTNDELPSVISLQAHATHPSSLGIRHSFVIRHWAFVICVSYCAPLFSGARMGWFAGARVGCIALTCASVNGFRKASATVWPTRIE